MAPGRTTPEIRFFCLIALKLHFEMSDSPRHFLIIWYLSWDVRTCQKSVTPHGASFHDTQKWHWPQVLSSTLERISGDNSGITRNATTLASRVTLRGAQMHPQLSVTRTCQAFIPHSLAFTCTPNLICCFDHKHPSLHLLMIQMCQIFTFRKDTDKLYLDFGKTCNTCKKQLKIMQYLMNHNNENCWKTFPPSASTRWHIVEDISIRL